MNIYYLIKLNFAKSIPYDCKGSKHSSDCLINVIYFHVSEHLTLQAINYISLKYPNPVSYFIANRISAVILTLPDVVNKELNGLLLFQ